jgi:hypothetical protein
MSIASRIGSIVSAQAFVTWNAHMFFAYFVIYTFHPMWLVPTFIVVTALKEFWWDKHFEMAQPFKKNLIDWFGYSSGVLLALAARAWL